MIRALKVVKIIINFINYKKKLDLVRYNKKLQYKLNIELKDYICYNIEEDFEKEVEKTKKILEKENFNKIMKLKKIFILYFNYKIKYFNKLRRIKFKWVK